MSDLEYMLIDCKSIFGLRAIALMLSGENFFKGCISVGYGLRRYYLSSSGFNCTTLWLFFDPRGTAVSKNKFCGKVYQRMLLYFFRLLVFFYSIFHLQKHVGVMFFWYKCNTIICFLHNQ